MKVTFVNGLKLPLIPTGIIFTFAFSAKNTAPFFTLAFFSKPFLVPSGKIPNTSLFFSAFKHIFIEFMSLLSLFTGIISNKCPKYDNILNLYKSALAINLIGNLLQSINPAASK